MVRAEICAKDVPKLRMAVPTTAPHCDKHLHHDWPEVFSYSIRRLFEIQTHCSLSNLFDSSEVKLILLFWFTVVPSMPSRGIKFRLLTIVRFAGRNFPEFGFQILLLRRNFRES